MELFTDILVEKGINQQVSGYLSVVIMVFIILITCVLANLIVKKVVISIITYFTKRNKLKWNEILLKRKVFHCLFFRSCFSNSSRPDSKVGSHLYLYHSNHCNLFFIGFGK